jgi:hypothetical protein
MRRQFMLDLLTIAKATATLVGPYLIKLRESTEQKVSKGIEEHGGEFALAQAGKAWNLVKEWWHDDEEMISIAKLMEKAPEKATRQEEFIEALAQRLADAPDKRSVLQELLGGEKGILRMIGGQDAKFVGAEQKGKAGSEMTMQGGDRSDFSHAKQTQE